MSLSERVRPDSECPQWVIDEIREMEQKISDLETEIEALREERDTLKEKVLMDNDDLAEASAWREDVIATLRPTYSFADKLRASASLTVVNIIDVAFEEALDRNKSAGAQELFNEGFRKGCESYEDDLLEVLEGKKNLADQLSIAIRLLGISYERANHLKN